MEQLCVHALLVQLYAKHLVAEGEVPPAPGTHGFGGGPPWVTDWRRVRSVGWYGWGKDPRKRSPCFASSGLRSCCSSMLSDLEL